MWFARKSFTPNQDWNAEMVDPQDLYELKTLVEKTNDKLSEIHTALFIISIEILALGAHSFGWL